MSYLVGQDFDDNICRSDWEQKKISVSVHWLSSWVRKGPQCLLRLLYLFLLRLGNSDL